MLELKQVYWGVPNEGEIIKGISLIVPSGKLTVVTGPNGGGKTSIARLVAGLTKPAKGSILLDGTDITSLDMTERANLGIACAFQQPVPFKGLSVCDLLEVAAAKTLNDKKLKGLLEKVGLNSDDYKDRPMDNRLSGGEMKRIEIATVLARPKTKILIFDEPEAGIDLWSFSGLLQVFQALKEEKDQALLIISHQERILNIADIVVVIADGKVEKAGEREIILPQLLSQK